MKVDGGQYGFNSDSGECGGAGVDDFAFFEALLAFATRELCVDLSRVFTAGYSSGGMLSYSIACRFPDKIAAAAMNPGGMSHKELQKCAAHQGGAVPVQSFHSLSDDIVPYNDGVSMFTGDPVNWAGQREVAAMWRGKNGCDGSEAPRTTYNSSTTLCQRWDCPGAPIEHCALQDIDHCTSARIRSNPGLLHVCWVSRTQLIGFCVPLRTGWYGGRTGGYPSCMVRKGDVDATDHMFDFWEELARDSKQTNGDGGRGGG